MEILEKLKDQGWYLTEEGLKKLPDNNDVKKIISAALDFDFREIAGGALPVDLTKKDESFRGNIVLQVQRIRNISAPKANEESKAAPRFLQIELSDGVTLMQALEIEHISVLSMNTPPGTKIHFKCKQIPLLQGMIVLKAIDIQVLGGRVAALVEKWEMNRSLQKYAKSGRQQSGGSGPPPWIPLGQKVQQTVSTDKNFKSLAQAEKEKESGKENDEFNTMRSEAIAEAAKIAGKKIFGGGNHQILDHNVKKILEKGYTEEEAKNALRASGNSLERALYNLKRRGDDYKNRDDFREKYKTIPAGGSKRGGKEGGKRGSKEAEIAVPAKPATNVSLFDFLTDKLPTNTDQTPTISQSSSSATTTNTATTSHASQSTSSHSYSRLMTKAGSEPSSSKPYYNASSSSNTSHAGGGYHDRKQHQNQENSSSNKSQEQNNNTNSNRPKFENNLSSSFANRNSSHTNDERFNRYSNSNRARGGGHSGSGASSNPFHGRPNQPFEEVSDRHRDQKSNSGYNGGRGSGRGSHNNNYSGGRGGGSSSGGYDNRRYNDYHNQNKDQQNQHRHERQDRQDRQESSHQTQRNGNEQHKTASNGKEGSTSRYQHNSGSGRNYDNNRQSGYNASSNSNNNSNTSHNSNHNTNSSSNATNNNDHTARMNKLVESTSKMKIEKTRSGPSQRNHQQQQQHHQQQQNYAPQQQQQAQQQQQNQQLHPQQPKQNHPAPPMNSTTTQKLQQTFGPLPNGFNYDPSKIIGFQAKETNEFALTLLKSQGVVPTGPTPLAAAPQVPSPVAQAQFIPAPPPPAIHLAPQPFATTTFVVPQAVAPPTVSPTAYGMIPGENWNWKIADRCLAKYWDDGKYYEAEITGISDKTCVVLFLGYGNHEEVLKSDCHPITDAQNRTINFSTNMQHAPSSVSVAAQQQQQQQQQQASMLSRGVPNRYRGERQVYVPPPKRDN